MELKTKNKKKVENSVDPNSTNWFTLKVQSNKERSIMERIKLDNDRNNVYIDNIIVPTEKVLMIKSGKKYNREKVIYPGYVFVETNRVGDFLQYIKTLPGATGLVKDMTGDPVYMRKQEIEKLIKMVEQKVEIDNTNFYEGENVMISQGPFSGFVGELTELNREKGKAKVSVKIFGRTTFVDLEVNQIDKVQL